jgi:hypothetical protein
MVLQVGRRMTDSLTDRLRAYLPRNACCGDGQVLATEAADALDAKDAEIDRLKRDLGDWTKVGMELTDALLVSSSKVELQNPIIDAARKLQTHDTSRQPVIVEQIKKALDNYDKAETKHHCATHGWYADRPCIHCDKAEE